MTKKPLGESKQTNQIIVRVDDETKTAFTQRVGDEGKSVSEVIKEFIQSYLAKEPQKIPDLLRMQANMENLEQRIAFLEDEAQKKSAA